MCFCNISATIDNTLESFQQFLGSIFSEKGWKMRLKLMFETTSKRQF